MSARFAVGVGCTAAGASGWPTLAPSLEPDPASPCDCGWSCKLGLSKGGVFSEHIFAAHLRIPRPQGRVSSVRAAAVQAQWSPPRVLRLKRCPARLCVTVPQKTDTRHWSVVCVAYTYCIPGATHRAHVLVCRVLSGSTPDRAVPFFARARGRRLLVGGGLAVLPLRHTTATHEWGISWSVCACVTRLIGYTPSC